MFRETEKQEVMPCVRCDEPGLFAVWGHLLCGACCREWHEFPHFSQASIEAMEPAPGIWVASTALIGPRLSPEMYAERAGRWTATWVERTTRRAA